MRQEVRQGISYINLYLFKQEAVGVIVSLLCGTICLKVYNEVFLVLYLGFDGICRVGHIFISLDTLYVLEALCHM